MVESICSDRCRALLPLVHDADLALENTAVKGAQAENCSAACEAAGRREPPEGARDVDRAGLQRGEAVADGVVLHERFFDRRRTFVAPFAYPQGAARSHGAEEVLG
jgi:hypothetical protein